MDYEFGEGIYLRNEDEVRNFFEGKENALLILGCGFDPRMNVGVKTLNPLIINLDVWVLHYGRNNNSRSKINNKISQGNLSDLKQICKNIFEIRIERFAHGNEKSDIAYMSIKEKIQRGMLLGYKHIIIDISAMPRTISFSLVEYIRRIKDVNQKVYILVCENSKYDDKIEEIPARDAAQYMQCFNLFSAGREAVSESTTVWVPVMGYHELAAFKKIAEYVRADEICPVIPFPAEDIRRGEEIIRNYGDYLFKNLKIEKRNIMYAPEKAPMLVYTKLVDTILSYERALCDIADDEETRYVFSSQSSKLIDVGILLALLDLKKKNLIVTMAYVENGGYSQPEPCDEKYNHLSCVCMDDKEFEW